MQRQTTEILKLKILQKKSIVEYLKQKNKSSELEELLLLLLLLSRFSRVRLCVTP